MLNEKEHLEFRNGVPCAITPPFTGSTRQLDGCKLLVQSIAINDQIKREIKRAEEYIEQLSKRQAEELNIIKQLRESGYCEIDFEHKSEDLMGNQKTEKICQSYCKHKLHKPKPSGGE